MGYKRVGPQRQKPKPLQPLNSTDSFTQSAYRPPRLQARTFGWSPSVTERQRRVTTAGVRHCRDRRSSSQVPQTHSSLSPHRAWRSVSSCPARHAPLTSGPASIAVGLPGFLTHRSIFLHMCKNRTPHTSPTRHFYHNLLPFYPPQAFHLMRAHFFSASS